MLLRASTHPGAGRASARPLAKEMGPLWSRKSGRMAPTPLQNFLRKGTESTGPRRVTYPQPTPTPMLAITTASATSFSPAATLNPVKSAALLITQLDTVGFDACRAQSKIKGVEQSISAPLRAVSRQADRLAARVCIHGARVCKRGKLPYAG